MENSSKPEQRAGENPRPEAKSAVGDVLNDV